VTRRAAEAIGARLRVMLAVLRLTRVAAEAVLVAGLYRE
jgi:hypothetical protein